MSEQPSDGFEIRENAPAKLNLCLHTGSRRDDGYHLLESLIVFTAFGDSLTLRGADETSISRSGPFADGLPDRLDDDLTMRAVGGLATLCGRTEGVAVSLRKEIPVAAGLGGGSADAAAAIRGLCRVWDVDVEDRQVRTLALELGADVPVCLYGGAAWAEGIGEILTPLSNCPPLHILLVNPNQPLSTAAVFSGLNGRQTDAAGRPPRTAEMQSESSFLAYVADQRNDLTEPAVELCPVIADVLAVLAAQPDCGLARMSGSGPTCFGVFPDRAACERAGAAISAQRSDWWVRSTSAGVAD